MDIVGSMAIAMPTARTCDDTSADDFQILLDDDGQFCTA